MRRSCYVLADTNTKAILALRDHSQSNESKTHLPNHEKLSNGELYEKFKVGFRDLSSCTKSDMWTGHQDQRVALPTLKLR